MRDKRVLIGDFTRREFREMLAAGTVQAAIVPTGTTEQHLEHLEMCHDSASVTHVAHEAARNLHPSVVVAPTVQVGVSEHHMAHPGTLTTRVGTFLDYVFDICESITRTGIENVLILNGHGGHMHCLRKEVVRYRQLLRCNVVYASYWDLCADDEVYPLVQSGYAPGHANEYETSFGLAAFPERVHEDLMDDEQAQMGTREHGMQQIETVVGHVSDLLRRMIAGESPTIEPHSFRPTGTVIGAENFPYQAGRSES
jgi:creatinine amidohydrolase